MPGDETEKSQSHFQNDDNRLRAVVEHLADGLAITDEDGILTIWNPKLEEITGIAADQVIGKPFWVVQHQIFAPEQQTSEILAEYESALKHLLSTGKSSWGGQKITREHRLPNNTLRYVQGNVFSIKTGHGYILGSLFRDVTERKIAEQKSSAYLAELEQTILERTKELSKQITESAIINNAMTNLLEDSQKINQRLANTTRQLKAAYQELESFTYSVSHDLRAPLRAIDGFSRILVETYGSKLEPKANHYLHNIRDGAQQMDQLIFDLLNLSRLGSKSVQKQYIDPNIIVEQTIQELKDEMKDRDVELIISDLPAGMMDPALIKQVFINLIANALKFTAVKKKAKIEIGVGSPPADSTQQFDMQPENTYYVRDNGVGFDMAYVDKLFGVFQRLHPPQDYEGTGVGLAIVKRIIHRHDGRVWAEGEVGKGATFYFTIPIENETGG